MRCIHAAALLLAATVMFACGDEQPSSGTGGRIEPTNAVDLAPDAVLEFEDRQYAPVAIVGGSTVDTFSSAGTGRLYTDEGEREIEVFIDEDGDTDKRVYTADPTPLEGGAEGPPRVLWAPIDDANPPATATP